MPGTSQQKKVLVLGAVTLITLGAVETELKVSTDGDDLFKRMLWRPVTAGDEIQAAERRVWENPEDGLRAWQGFLKVKPSDELKSYLARNPFRLKKKGKAEDLGEILTHAPNWVPRFEDSQRYQIQTSRDGMLFLIQDLKEEELFVLGQGKGFKLNR